jgi:hypothetical protein
MKLVARAVTALALLAFATPALPCGDKAHGTTTASSEKKGTSNTVAKSGSEKEKKTTQGQKTNETRPATAAN